MIECKVRRDKAMIWPRLGSVIHKTLPRFGKHATEIVSDLTLVGLALDDYGAT